MAEDVAAIVERCEAEVCEVHEQEFPFDRQRNAQLGVQDKELIAPYRHIDLAARRRIRRIVADGNRLLWSRAVQRESAKRAAAPREEQLAERHVATGKRSCQAEPDAVCPDHAADGLVDRGLSEELAEARVRSENARIHVKLQAVVCAFMGIQWIVARVPKPYRGQSGQARVQIAWRHQLGDQEIRQSSLTERVPELQVLCPGGVDRPLKLERALSDPCIEDGVFFVVLSGPRDAGSPSCPAEIRILEQKREAPVERSIQSTERDRFGLAAQVVQRVLEIDARSLKTLLACLEFRGQADGRQSRQRNSSGRDTSAPVDDLVAETIGDGVAWGFVNLDDHVFVFL